MAGIPGVLRVRVVLLDGLGLAMARQLPHLNRACAEGVDAVVDNGFPTVSLPVQHVLWTGLTQAQSGVMYRVGALLAPPEQALPTQVPGSLAVAESHSEIVNSFGFAQVLAPVGIRATTPEQLAWRREGFASAARAAVMGMQALAFIHVLKVDEAGHASGSASQPYRKAAEEADELLAELLAAQPDRQDTRWFLLSDHGHRAAGGHADAEPEIRMVRLCVVGGGVLPAATSSSLHLVDVYRAIADSLAVQAHPLSLGRPWSFALAHPDPDATLLRPSPLRWLLADLLWLAGLALTTRLARRHLSLWPWWCVLGALSFVAIRGAITLSNPAVYPPLGLATASALAPGLLLLALQSGWALRRHSPTQVVLSALLAPLMLLLGSGVLSGALQAQLGMPPSTPVMPTWSAAVSVAATACASASLVLALVLLVFHLVALRAAKRRLVAGGAAT